jgi:protein gp37
MKAVTVVDKREIKHGTTIEWTRRPGTRGETLNPIRARRLSDGKLGWHCTHKNIECIFCYAERLNLKGGASGGTGFPYKPGHLQNGDVEVFLDENVLTKPLHWKSPCTIFVCSMTDLFADFVSDEWIDKVFAVAALSPQHTFIILTKRPDRMERYFNGPYPNGDGVLARIAEQTFELVPPGGKLPDCLAERPIGPLIEGQPEFGWRRFLHPKAFPFRNVWLGTSCGSQQTADENAAHLRATPAAVRFLSVEPMIGPVQPDLTGIGWVICGGESGPFARPRHPEWARLLRDQCAVAGVRYFDKQQGEWAESDDDDAVLVGFDPDIAEHDCAFDMSRAARMKRVGREKAGRLLDGREHNEFPQVDQ